MKDRLKILGEIKHHPERIYTLRTRAITNLDSPETIEKLLAQGPFVWCGEAPNKYIAAARACEDLGKWVDPEALTETEDPYYSPEGYAYRARMDRMDTGNGKVDG